MSDYSAVSEFDQFIIQKKPQEKSDEKFFHAIKIVVAALLALLAAEVFLSMAADRAAKGETLQETLAISAKGETDENAAPDILKKSIAFPRRRVYNANNISRRGYNRCLLENRTALPTGEKRPNQERKMQV